MVSEAPPFWWTERDWRARLLTPFAFLYGRVAVARMERARPKRVAVPVLCVGNFTVGGAGKTPTAIALATRAKERGLKPGFLSRGYGGSLGGVVRVDPHHHRARDVGDEPLLLAAVAPTVTARNRHEGALGLIDDGIDFIIMDDGFQSRRLGYDLALLVVDARRGLGNGGVIPAGPLRAPVTDQLRHAAALLTVGEGRAADAVVRQAARAGKPIHEAHLRPRPVSHLEGRAVLAFAGIGDPEKFFRTLEGTGAVIAERRIFGDHHSFTEDEIASLLDAAAQKGLTLVTTSKDMARLAGEHGRARELAETAEVLAVDLVFDEPAVPDALIDQTMAAFKRRRISGGSAG